MTARKGFKIGEVCKLLDIQPYVLRYWETEFVALHPAKSLSGQRVYAETEVAVIRRIKELLYEEGYTIAGAKKKLESDVVLEGKVAAPAAGLFDHESEVATAVEGRSPEAVLPGKPAQLDTDSAERIERFRRGVEAALAEARAVLAILDRHPR